jgi:hypothetical protein
MLCVCALHLQVLDKNNWVCSITETVKTALLYIKRILRIKGGEGAGGGGGG